MHGGSTDNSPYLHAWKLKGKKEREKEREGREGGRERTNEELPQVTTIFHWCYLLNPLQFSSVTQSCPTLCDPMNCSTPGLPVRHQLLEFTQIHVQWVGDAIQPSHPLLSPSPPAPNPLKHQCLFQWVNSLHEVAKVLEFQLQASVLPVNTQDWSPLGWIGWISLQYKGTLKSSPTPQFKSINSLALSFLHSLTLTSIHDHWGNQSLD